MQGRFALKRGCRQGRHAGRGRFALKGGCQACWQGAGPQGRQRGCVRVLTRPRRPWRERSQNATQYIAVCTGAHIHAHGSFRPAHTLAHPYTCTCALTKGMHVRIRMTCTHARTVLAHALLAAECHWRAPPTSPSALPRHAHAQIRTHAPTHTLAHIRTHTNADKRTHVCTHTVGSSAARQCARRLLQRASAPCHHTPHTRTHRWQQCRSTARSTAPPTSPSAPPPHPADSAPRPVLVLWSAAVPAHAARKAA